MYVFGMPRGLESVPSVVRPRTSVGPRTMTNLSAPGFRSGAFVPAGSPAKLYTPDKSGLALVVALLFVEAGPATVTGRVFDGPLRNVSVYVVVATGLICLLPRAATSPISGSIEMPLGFSVAQTNNVDSPGRIEAGLASNVTIRGSGCGRCASTEIAEAIMKQNTKRNSILTCKKYHKMVSRRLRGLH